ncbi:MAG: class I SAM-dependent methyltransferase [Pseudomonadota bacterium]
MEIPNIDWNEVWRAHYGAKAASRKRDESFWDRRAPEFNRHASAHDYVNQFIALLDPRPDWTILDVGSAAGTLAVPLACKVAAVTAMDPSRVMREILTERCARQGLSNIRVLNGRWQDDWDELGIEIHDVAIASRSLAVEDLAGAIVKLDGRARKRVYLTTLVGDGPFDRRLFAAVGREFKPDVDHTVVYNILAQMGFFPNVAFTVHREDHAYETLDEAFGNLNWMFHGMTGEEEDRLRRHLASTLVRKDGLLELPYRRIVRWAVIWWDKEMDGYFNEI